MSMDDKVVEPVNVAELATDESVLMSMDNIAVDDKRLDMDSILNNGEAMVEENETSPGLTQFEGEDVKNSETLEQQELIPEIDQVPAEIDALLKPFESNSVGEDPRYGDEFVLIKTEIDKLAFNDYNAVMTLAKEILLNVGKDIRVAGYFMLANTYINGVQGLIEGLILYRLLLEKYGDEIYPQKESARNSSLLWLNNNKLVAYTKQSQAPVTLESVNMVAKQLERFNEVIIRITNDKTLCLNSLNNWIKEKRKKLDIPKQAPALKEEKESSDLNKDVTKTSKESALEPTRQTVVSRAESNPLADVDMSSAISDTELYSFIRKIVKQLMAEKGYARGISYARAARWGGFSMPPHEKNKTRITPPRQSGISQITSLLGAGSNEDALRKCEGIFFEMGGHILLDLQMYACKAATALGNIDIANLIKYETAAFLQRFPGIETLRFDDDTPCANSECQAWLNNLSGSNKSAIPLISASEDNNELLENINKACEEANDKDLNAGLVMLDDYRPKTEKQRFQLKLGMSQLCLDHGRAELALPMLDELSEQANRTSLAIWDVGLAMSAARQLQNALRSVMADADEKNRAHYEQRLNEVTAQMCRWDLAQAAQFL